MVKKSKYPRIRVNDKANLVPDRGPWACEQTMVTDKIIIELGRNRGEVEIHTINDGVEVFLSHNAAQMAVIEPTAGNVFRLRILPFKP